MENALSIMETTHGIDVRALAVTVHRPTLVLHAVGDAMCPFENGRMLAALIPGARFVPLESRNHVLLESEPAWTRFLEEVRAFLGAEAGWAEPRVSTGAEAPPASGGQPAHPVSARW
jgi:pimeloyl-ACP methyl ester carboxylesterase